MNIFSKKSIAVLLFIFAIVVSLPELSITMKFADMDAYARANWGYGIFLNHSWLKIYSGAWLPFHAMILSLSHYLSHDPLVAPRLLTLFFGAGSISLMYLYTKKLFSSLFSEKTVEYLSILTALFYCLLPFRLSISTVPLSESISAFFLLALLYLLISNRDQLILISVFISISAGVRYEFWLIIPVVLVWVLLNSRVSRSGKALFSVSLFIIPSSWICLNYFQRGDALYFLHEKISDAMCCVPEVPFYSFMSAFTLWTSRLIDCIGVSGLFASILGLVGFQYYCKEKTIAVVIPLFLFFSLIFQVYFGTMGWAPQRYLYAVVCCLMPFIVFGSYTLIKKCISYRSIYVVIAGFILAIFFGRDYFILSRKVIDQKKVVSVDSLISYVSLIDYLMTDKAISTKTVRYISEGGFALAYIEYFTQNHRIISTSLKDFQSSSGFDGTAYIFDMETGNEYLDKITKHLEKKFQNERFTVRQ